LRWHFQIFIVCLALATILVKPLSSASFQGDMQAPNRVYSQEDRSRSTHFLPSSSPLPIEEYWQLVRNTEAFINDLEGLPTDVVQTRLQGITDQWRTVKAVLLPDGTIVPVDHSFIVSQLSTDEPDLEALSALLNALLAERDSWPRGRFTEADIQALNDILARAEFQWKPAQPSPLQELWNRVQRGLGELLMRIFGSDGIAVGFSILEYVLIALGILAIFLVLIYALRGVRMSIVQETELDPDGEAGDEGLDADSALGRAQELSSQGNYRQAVRYLYLSSLLLLEERGLLSYDRSRTNREYLRSVAHLPELSTSLSKVVDIFDRVWYGYQALDQATFEHYSEEVAKLRRQR
jgi:hypothetical protein